MQNLSEKTEVASRLHMSIMNIATKPEKGLDVMVVIQLLSGILVESAFFFERPDESLDAAFDKLSLMLDAEPWEGDLPDWAMPPPHILDLNTERGRELARQAIESWHDCEFSYVDFILFLVQNFITSWEDEGIPREEAFRLLVEGSLRCMAFEVAAQELCDLVIERKIGFEGWSLADGIGALSAAAGQRLACALGILPGAELNFGAYDFPQHLDNVVYVMTQEAVRLGIPAGSDWRLGLAANDCPADAPEHLIQAVEPMCLSFFRALNMMSEEDQAVSLAKAAGRMLAVAAGGDMPEMAPEIAKPLAMAAMTETYKSLSVQQP